MVASLSRMLGMPSAAGSSAERARPLKMSMKHPTKPTGKPGSKKWCGKYCLEAANYTEDTVGPKALHLQFLKRSVGCKLLIENSVSIPFGTISEILESHYENAGPATQVRRAHEVEGAGQSSWTLRSKNWKRCRHALSQLKIPALMTEDLLSAFFAQNMVVPTTKLAWEQFRVDIADSAALLFTPTYVDSVESISNPLDLPVSILVRDMQPREYDYSVTIDNSGDVSGEVRLPYSTNRGMKFATQGPGTQPGTVRPPVPHVGYAVCSATVALDGVYLPQAVSRHHAASTWSPPKNTFEGDNMLVMPQYKQQVYNMLTDMVKQASDLIPLGSSTFTVSGYITKRMEVVISDVSAEDVSESPESLWSWDTSFV